MIAFRPDLRLRSRIGFAEGPIALLDWDGTLRGGFTIQDWADQLVSDGLIGADVPGHLVELVRAYGRGDLDHDNLADSSARLLASHLRGVLVERVIGAANRFVEHDAERLLPYAEGLIDLLGNRGLPTVILSGAPDEVLAAYQRKLHFSAHAGLLLTSVRGQYDGGIGQNPGTAEQKEAGIRDLEKRQLHPHVAFGDSISDIPMWRAARLRFLIGDDVPVDPALHLVSITGALADLDVIEAVMRSGEIG